MRMLKNKEQKTQAHEELATNIRFLDQITTTDRKNEHLFEPKCMASEGRYRSIGKVGRSPASAVGMSLDSAWLTGSFFDRRNKKGLKTKH